MSAKQAVSAALHGLRVSFVALTVVQFSLGGPLVSTLQAHEKEHARTPIKHLIVLIGENRTFDHVFATYVPKSHDSVSNLLSKGIINADGTPGPHFSKAAQFQAVPPFKTKYYISLDADDKTPYQTLPPPTLNFSPSPDASIIGFATEPPPFPPATPTFVLAAIDPSLKTANSGLLTTGGPGEKKRLLLP